MSSAPHDAPADIPPAAASPAAAPPAAAPPAAGPQPAAEAPLPSLSPAAFGLSLAIVLVLFVVLNPLWEPQDMGAFERNIGWSYAPIPLLVGFFLLLEGKRRLAAFFIETLRLTLVKFAITWVAANLYWAVAGLPQIPAGPDSRPAAVAAAPGVFSERRAPAATVLDSLGLGGLKGQVLDARGRVVAGALVWVSSGLERYDFTPPARPAVFEHRGSGFTPARAVVHAFQPVLLSSRGSDLHSAQLVGPAGRVLFTYPLLPGGDRRLMFGHELGLVSLACTLAGHDEPVARLLVMSHPFGAVTDARGRFSWSGVPAGALGLSACGDGSAGLSGGATVAAEAQLELVLEAGHTAEVDLVLLAPAG